MFSRALKAALSGPSSTGRDSGSPSAGRDKESRRARP
jgi:hypothetical protein